MDFSAVFDKFAPILRRHWLVLALISAGVICFCVGLIGLLHANTAQNNVSFSGTDESAVAGIATTSATSATAILVDIEGGVLNPGVYSLPTNSRVKDVLVKAGGLSESADRNWILKNLNMAAKLSDAEKLYIPVVGDTVTADNSSTISGGSGTAVLGTQSALININNCSEQDLDNLPGIGPVTAQKIIGARPFSSVDDLLTRKVVSKNVFDKIKDKVVAQ